MLQVGAFVSEIAAQGDSNDSGQWSVVSGQFGLSLTVHHKSRAKLTA